MEEWGFNPSTVSALGSIAVLIVLVTVGIEFIQNRRARNLEAILTLSTDMRKRWESEWEHLLREKIPSLSPEDRKKGEVGRELRYMLNWMDWIGLMVKMKLINKEILLGTLAFMIKEILKQAADIIQSDIEDPEKGAAWWANVLFMAKQQRIDIDITKEAEELRQKWHSTAKQEDY